MIWISLVFSCIRPVPPGPSPAAQSEKIAPPILVETPRSMVGLSLLVKGGSAADPVGQEGSGSLAWSVLESLPEIDVFKEAGGQVRSEWRRDYGVFHYTWSSESDVDAPLRNLVNAQLSIDWNSEGVDSTLDEKKREWGVLENDRGIPSLSDAWMSIGLTGHPYAHPARGTLRSRETIETTALQEAFERLFCTGNIHVGVAAKSAPKLPEGIEDKLNSLGACASEPPTPKPFPIVPEPRLLLLESRAEGTQAFVALPHRSTSSITTQEELQWAAELISNRQKTGALDRAIARSNIEAMADVRLSPRAERRTQPLLQIEVRTQSADPIDLFDLLTDSLANLSADGWSSRDIHRRHQHLSALKKAPSTTPRLASQLMASAFGPTAKAKASDDPETTYEALKSAFQPTIPSMVMEVSDAAALKVHAEARGFQVQVLSSDDFVQPDSPNSTP